MVAIPKSTVAVVKKTFSVAPPVAEGALNVPHRADQNFAQKAGRILDGTNS
jgi:hypothetical protein